jgi:heme/copper-type cytochrome/quinol oxidase subunit 2
VHSETARTTAPRARRRLEKAWLVFPAVIVLVIAIVFVVGFVL